MTERPNPILHKTFWFWCALLAPILIAIDLGFAMVYLTPKIQSLLAFSKINSLILELKAPIAIAGLAIPLVAMAAAVHRSSQTAHQIQEQMKQNDFSNHFKHLEEFKKAIGDDIPSPWLHAEDLYRLIYPNSIDGKIDPYEYPLDYDRQIEEMLEEIERNPLETNNICLETYMTITSEITGPNQHKIGYRGYNVSPDDLLHLESTLNKAYTFAGRNPVQFRLTPSFSEKIRSIEMMDRAINLYIENDNTIEHILTSPPSLVDGNRSIVERLQGSLGVSNEDFLAAMASAWEQINLRRLDGFRVTHDMLYPEALDFIKNDVEPVFNLSLTELRQSSRGLFDSGEST